MYWCLKRRQWILSQIGTKDTDFNAFFTDSVATGIEHQILNFL